MGAVGESRSPCIVRRPRTHRFTFQSPRLSFDQLTAVCRPRWHVRMSLREASCARAPRIHSLLALLQRPGACARPSPPRHANRPRSLFATTAFPTPDAMRRLCRPATSATHSSPITTALERADAYNRWCNRGGGTIGGGTVRLDGIAWVMQTPPPSFDHPRALCRLDDSRTSPREASCARASQIAPLLSPYTTTSRSLVRANPPRSSFATAAVPAPNAMSRSHRPAPSAAHALVPSPRLTNAQIHARYGDASSATQEEAKWVGGAPQRYRVLLLSFDHPGALS
ncbi:uncharacterized protein LAESUDRAFT_554772 [Laetiporus sulphureus 93-53]|uniref:Uncharacterized protein n=1 Tax=Laetiporus sulphureus 93-53 TaxID=1314785 RepID=A0A165B7D2_9APHY|nr:uncharacterized protein LAESUDRAFT_554772 [Laetiporus sulphureus 93-53]KZT00413.1 hypothetical protein LAESUDRAFT_554772 [Laetiporus sulphureus 93-53]